MKRTKENYKSRMQERSRRKRDVDSHREAKRKAKREKRVAEDKVEVVGRVKFSKEELKDLFSRD